jgi:hypothetical protein
MQINLTEPSIEWGNDNFKVDADGKMTAKEGVFNGALTAGEKTRHTDGTEHYTLEISNDGEFKVYSKIYT